MSDRLVWIIFAAVWSTRSYMPTAEAVEAADDLLKEYKKRLG